MQIDSGNDFLKLNVSNSRDDSVAFELKFAKSLSIIELKKKLEIITGGSARTMQLRLYHNDNLVATLSDDEAILGSLQIDNGMRLHVIDCFTHFAEDNVEKFELTADQYDSKNDTVRSFLKKNKLGKYNEEEMRVQEERRRQQEEMEKNHLNTCVIGSRCQVTVTGNPTRRGTIQYNGPLEGKKGTFIGVEYDEPLGRNNGSIAGKVYFTCQPNYGGFVNPMSVEVGDFPIENYDIDDEI